MAPQSYAAQGLAGAFGPPGASSPAGVPSPAFPMPAQQQAAAAGRPWTAAEVLMVSAGAFMLLLNMFVVMYVLLLRYLMSEMRVWVNKDEI